eukprot:CAMPEP_0201553068 /NCGR_PEP_ID=MMETSP0173_2-20130828/19424_1 /ASSEMBLY_ACC=CAM_ASM_000268 /TAXON_ID=218659 /ORGANISM="Vexillifera sp., Strain DIVA3 564/2" /LENGTH=251 /DNA_ID=CAMNT_0047963671 /DNA_START=150 /DNA_END=901 /DNA_ORIENTATION=-
MIRNFNYPMTKITIFISLFIVIFLPTYCLSQDVSNYTCFPFNVTTDTSPDVADFCSNLLISPFAWERSEEQLAQRIALTPTLIQGLSVISDSGCRDFAINIGCTAGPDRLETYPGFGGVRQCLWTTSSSNPDQFIPIIQEWQICTDYCEAFGDACRAHFSTIGIEVPDCSHPRFTNGPIVVSHPETGAILSFPCLNYTGAGDFQGSTCSGDGITERSDGSCAMECPSPMLTDHQEDQIWYLHSIVGWFSMA